MNWDFGHSQIPPAPDRATRILFLIALCLGAGSVLAALVAYGGAR